MAEMMQWEYKVMVVGSFWSEPQDDKMEAALNELGMDGWEVISVFAMHSTNKVRMVAKRPLSIDDARRRRRNWAG